MVEQLFRELLNHLIPSKLPVYPVSEDEKSKASDGKSGKQKIA